MAKKGFSNLVITNSSKDIAKLRKDINKDFKKKMKKIKKAQSDDDSSEDAFLERWDKLTVFQQWETVQQNAAARLAALAPYAETSGPNAGKIVIPATYDDKAQALFGLLLDGYVGTNIDLNNTAGASMSLTLWDILSSGSDDHNLASQLLGGVFFLRTAAQGLLQQPLVPGYGSNPLGGLVFPRLAATIVGR